MLLSPSTGASTDHDELIGRLQCLFAQQAPGAAYHPQQTGNSRLQLREAAVLIPILRATSNEGCRVLLTLRSDALSNHAGQVSLPGGTRDADDRDAVHTALREAGEEVGLAADAVEIIGQLPAVNLPSGFRVTPVVGLLEPDTPLRAAPDEVAAIFHAPGSLVLTPSHYERFTMNYRNRPREVLQLHYQHYRIWGATAAILHGLGQSLQQLEAGR